MNRASTTVTATRVGARARAVVAIVVLALLVGGLSTSVLAQTGPDKSEVVIVLDFSASILKDKTNRNRFGAALERIADRVEATSLDLIAGDATVSIVQFATRASDQPGCAELHLLGSPAAVKVFANCLRSVAHTYRRGLSNALTKRIGVDTNYVAAMEQAAKHLPADAVRPAMILLTDGKHDVKGVPVSQVQVAFQRLFGTRTPLAVLPVGMGLDAKARGALEAGLLGLRVIRDMPPCVSGTPFDWPTVVFKSADEAGNAVAVALQDATCTFTVEETPTPSTTPVPTPGVVSSIRLTPTDGAVKLVWAAPPPDPAAPIVDFQARCRVGEGPWIESTEGVSLETTTTVSGLSNGSAYNCEVAVVGASRDLVWTPAGSTVTPLAVPPAPGKPSVTRLDRAVQVSLPAADPASVSSFEYECSGDNGGTWPAIVEAPPDNPTGLIGSLSNGVAYVCRAFAVNSIGRSEASPISDSVSPCGSALECNAVLAPILGFLALLAFLGVAGTLVAMYRTRTKGYVVAVIDVIHTVNLGSGSSLGISFVRTAHSRSVTEIVANRGRKAELKIRHRRGGRFEVTDRDGRHATTSGEPLVVVDSLGSQHELVLRAFDTNSALSAPSRR